MQRIKHHFTSTLIDWFSNAKRDLPWRKTKDPYRIWLSEIILQQTRIDQGKPYYDRFVEHHPTVDSLAKSDEKSVLKLWEGLGYYSRARNLHHTAKYVSNDLKGTFPQNYEGLIKLKGIGPYTAAAIASIAYDEAKPVVDGNVFRFASRYFGVEDDISKPATRKVFENLMLGFIPAESPGDFNQAVMEFGATICTPAPKCDNCVFREGCFAYRHKKQTVLPVKSQKVKVEERELNYVIFDCNGVFLLHSRKEGIWRELYQFYLSEDTTPEVLATKYKGSISFKSEKIRHLLTHRRLWVTFTHVNITDMETLNLIGEELGLSTFSFKEMLTLPRPKVIVNYLQRIANSLIL